MRWTRGGGPSSWMTAWPRSSWPVTMRRNGASISLSWSGRHDLDRQRRDCVQRVVEPPDRRPGEADGLYAFAQGVQHQFSLQPRDHLAEALVDAEAEADMAARHALDAKIVGIVPLARIAIGGGEKEQDLGALGDGGSGDVDVAGGGAEEGLDRRIPTQALVEGALHQIGAGAELGPFVGEGREGQHHMADAVH